MNQSTHIPSRSIFRYTQDTRSIGHSGLTSTLGLITQTTPISKLRALQPEVVKDQPYYNYTYSYKYNPLSPWSSTRDSAAAYEERGISAQW